MENLQEATEKICDLKGTVLAQHAMLVALIQTVQAHHLPGLLERYSKEIEAGTTVLLNAEVSEHTVAAFERDSRALSTTVQTRIAHTGIRG